MKVLIVRTITTRGEDYYANETILGIVPATDSWMEISQEDFWLLKRHLSNDYRILTDETMKVQEFLAEAKKKEQEREEKAKRTEAQRKKAAATKKARARDKKLKQLENLKKELGVE